MEGSGGALHGGEAYGDGSLLGVSRGHGKRGGGNGTYTARQPLPTHSGSLWGNLSRGNPLQWRSQTEGLVDNSVQVLEISQCVESDFLEGLESCPDFIDQDGQSIGVLNELVDCPTENHGRRFAPGNGEFQEGCVQFVHGHALLTAACNVTDAFDGHVRHVIRSGVCITIESTSNLVDDELEVAHLCIDKTFRDDGEESDSAAGKKRMEISKLPALT